MAIVLGSLALTSIGLGSAHNTATLLRWIGLVLLLALCTRVVVAAVRTCAVRIMATNRHERQKPSPPCPHCEAVASMTRDNAATGTNGGEVARLR